MCEPFLVCLEGYVTIEARGQKPISKAAGASDALCGDASSAALLVDSRRRILNDAAADNDHVAELLGNCLLRRAILLPHLVTRCEHVHTCETQCINESEALQTVDGTLNALSTKHYTMDL